MSPRGSGEVAVNSRVMLKFPPITRKIIHERCLGSSTDATGSERVSRVVEFAMAINKSDPSRFIGLIGNHEDLLHHAGTKEGMPSWRINGEGRAQCSDFRILHTGVEYWAPGNCGFPLAHVHTPPTVSFKNSSYSSDP